MDGSISCRCDHDAGGSACRRRNSHCDHRGAGWRRHAVLFTIRQHSHLVGWSGLATCHLCVPSCAHTIRSSLARGRDVHAIHVWARSRTVYWTTSLYLAVSAVIGSACRGFDAAEFLEPDDVRYIDSASFRDLCSLRDNLPERPVLYADRCEVGCTGIYRNRNAQCAGRTSLANASCALDKCGRCIPFHRAAWCRPGTRLVERVESALCFKTEVSCPPETTSAHRRQPLRIGRRLHVDRSDPRQNFQVWNWKPHRERAAAVRSRARTVAEKLGVDGSRHPVGDVARGYSVSRFAQRSDYSAAIIFYQGVFRLSRTTHAAKGGALPGLARLNHF